MKESHNKRKHRLSGPRSVFKAGLDGNWTPIAHDDDFLHYAIMQSSPCGRIVVIGSVGGKLLVVSTEGAFEVSPCKKEKQKRPI